MSSFISKTLEALSFSDTFTTEDGLYLAVLLSVVVTIFLIARYIYIRFCRNSTCFRRTAKLDSTLDSVAIDSRPHNVRPRHETTRFQKIDEHDVQACEEDVHETSLGGDGDASCSSGTCSTTASGDSPANRPEFERHNLPFRKQHCGCRRGSILSTLAQGNNTMDTLYEEENEEQESSPPSTSKFVVESERPNSASRTVGLVYTIYTFDDDRSKAIRHANGAASSISVHPSVRISSNVSKERDPPSYEELFPNGPHATVNRDDSNAED